MQNHEVNTTPHLTKPRPFAKFATEPLHDICANKGRNADEAAPYNGLIAVWSELTCQAAAIHDTRGDPRGSLEF